MRGLFFCLWGCLHAGAASAELIALRDQEGAAPRYQATNLSLESAQTKISCRERGAKIDCDFEARYVLQNYTEEAETLLLGLSLPGYSEEMKLLDGPENILRELSDDEQELLARSRTQRSIVRIFRFYQGIFSPLEGATLRLNAGQQRELIFRGKLRPQTEFGAYLSGLTNTPALQARHLAFSQEWASQFFFAMSFEDLACWPVVGEVTLSIEVPSRWSLVVDGEGAPFETKAGKGTQTFLFGVKENPTTNVRLLFSAKAPRLQGGGPMLGFGSVLGAEDPFLFRAGYEAGNHRGLLTSLAVETNFHSRVALVPQVGVGTSWVGYLPSLGFFVGAPTLIEQGQPLSVGLRVQLDVAYGAIGLSMPVDLYPVRQPTERLQTALLASFSF